MHPRTSTRRTIHPSVCHSINVCNAYVNINEQDQGGQRCVLKLLFHFPFFLITFSFFTLLISPSSSSLVPPHPLFLLVPYSSSSLLPSRPSFLLPSSSSSLYLPLPALSKSFRTRKRLFFIDFNESVTDQRTKGQGLL